MKRLLALLQHKEVHLVILCFSLAAFIVPIIAAPGLHRPEVLFIYIYVVWVILIGLLFLISRKSLSPKDGFKPGDKQSWIL